MAVSRSMPFNDTAKNFATLLKPGKGWLQLVELDTSPESVEPKKKDAIEDFKYLLETVSTASGAPTYFARRLAQSIRNAGLVEVQERLIEVLWGKAIVGDEALFQRSVAFPGIPYFAERFREIASKMGINDARFEGLPERLDKCLKETGGSVTAVVVWGRRSSQELDTVPEIRYHCMAFGWSHSSISQFMGDSDDRDRV